MQPKPLRCAIYTRKSTEDGLDKEFNSLDAQREACEAYIRSQKHEGWTLIDTPYDDGGYSGGTMERPGLKALLTDVKAGNIDVIAVYKVDRLSRSLSDFAQMVQILDAHQVSFVSITQQFNTTTSMGRLTLNMLLSFAQFEREVIGERVRDKIAASKQKGMWMGGIPPLGYDVVARKLVINPVEAQLVQKIFADYAAQQSLNQLAQKLNAAGHHNKRWITANGMTCGGQPFTNQSLSKILNNPAYLGRTRHRDKIYDGQHEAIISREMWDKVHVLLSKNLVRKKSTSCSESSLLLAGKCVDENGRPFTTTYTIKNKIRRYAYYLHKATSRRIRATELEAMVMHMLRSLSTGKTLRECGDHHITSEAHQRLQQLWNHWPAMPLDTQKRTLQTLTEKAVIATETLTLHLSFTAIDRILDDKILLPWPPYPPTKTAQQIPQHLRSKNHPAPTLPETPETTTIAINGDHIILSAAVKFTVQNRAQCTITADGKPIKPTPHPNPVLLKAIARSHRWNQMLDERKTTITAIACETKLGRPYVSCIINLKFLAPDIVKAILDGAQPRGLQLKQLMSGLPLGWEEQRVHLKIFG